ncbi:MAG: BTAD domain-containing putative transcriptional regulator [Gemmatimonadaceae bacterium]
MTARFYLFGPPDIRKPDGVAAATILSSPKSVALLARLAVASPGMARRDQLVGLLWPELDETRARNALSKALHQARRVFGEDAFAVRGNEEIGLAPGQWWCDLCEFEDSLARNDVNGAVSLSDRGALLDGVHLIDAPAFEPWLDAVRERVRSRLLKALLGRADEVEQTAASDALGYLARAGDLAPDDEAILRRRMQLLDRLGDRGGALRLFEQFSARLRREMDVDPSPETSALMEAISERRELSALPILRSTPAAAPSGSSPATATIAEARRDLPAATAVSRVPIRSAAIAAVVVAAVLFGALAMRPEQVRPVGVGNRVLVAPFANRTGDSSFRMLGAMVADFVAQGIQSADLLEVVDPLTSAMTTPSATDDSTDAARVLASARSAGAATVVSGAFYRRGDSLLFQAEVIDVAKQRRLAVVEPVTAGATDHVATATRVREATAGVMSTLFDVRFASTGADISPAPLLAAYREFRRGLELFPADQAPAFPHFIAAARLDTTFTQALIWACFSAPGGAVRDSLVRIIDARRERLRGIDRYAADYMVAGNLGGRLPEAMEATRAAAELSPGSHWSHNTSNFLLAQNRLEASLSYSRKIDPEHGWAGQWFPYWKNLTNALHLLGRYDEELLELRRAISLLNNDGSKNWNNYALETYEARALLSLGRVQEAAKILEGLAAERSDVQALAEGLTTLGQEFHRHGYPDHARRAFGIAVDVANRNQSSVSGVQQAALVQVRARGLYESGLFTEAAAVLDSFSPVDADSLHAAEAGVLQALLRASGSDLPSGRRLEQVKSNLYDRAVVAAANGDRDGAVRLVRELLDGYQQPEVVIWLHRQREWDPMRDYPPFRALTTPR